MKLIVLAGGKGTRLASVLNGVPKALAPVNGKPFLYYQMRNWTAQGVSEFFFLLHHGAKSIEDYLIEWQQIQNNAAFKINIVIEDEPLGTGGAVKNCVEKHWIEPSFVLVNADTWSLFNLNNLTKAGSEVLGVCTANENERFGAVEIDQDGFVVKFDDRQRPGNHQTRYISTGMGCYSSKDFLSFPHKSFSLEKDFLPMLSRRRRLKAVVSNEMFIDIGVPGDYQEFIQKMERFDGKKNIHIETGSSVAMAMDVIDSNKLGAVVIVDSLLKPVGLATDGDIRRFLLNGGTIHQEIDACMNSNFTFAEEPLSKEKLLKFLDNGLACIPLVDEFGVLVDLVTPSTIDYSTEGRVIVRARAPVRLSLSGGGSDLTSYMQIMEKGAVLQASVNLFVRCTMKPLTSGTIKYTSIDLDTQHEFKSLEHLLNTTEDLGLLKSIIEVVKPHFGFELIVGSDVRPKSGLGGSSAYVVAVLGCFNELRYDKWTNKEMVELAFKIERIHFGNVGGWQDQYAAVYGGVNYIEFNIDDNQIFPLRIPENTITELEECLVLCDVGNVHDSSLIQGELKKNIKSSENISAIQANVENCLRMKQALVEGELLTLAELLNQTWEMKRTFSKHITTDEIDSFYERCLAFGVLGGKLLGAGGAGFFLLFVDPAERLKLLRELSIIGIKAQPVNISQSGLKTWSLRENANS